MSDPNRQVDAAPEPVPPDKPGGLAGLLFRFLALIRRLRAWAGGSRTRGAAVAGTFLLLIVMTVAGWAYLASIAFRGGEFSLPAALAALDRGRYEEARTMVGQALRDGRLEHSQLGGPLYVLGAIKVNDAENNPAPDRQRIDYLVASRYLKEARAYGLPPDRAINGLYLFGRSLLASYQIDEGLQVLDDLLADKLTGDEPLAYEVHRLLAETCLFMPQPALDKALAHYTILLKDPESSVEGRADALLNQADCLARLHRFDEARQALAAVPAEAGRRAAVQLLEGRTTLDELEGALEKVATNDRSKLIEEWKLKTTAAIEQLKVAQSLDEQAGYIARQASYHLGRGMDLQGDPSAALRQFAHTRQLYPESLEGMAAALGEADLVRRGGDYATALAAYRRVLESFTGPASYRSDVLTLDQLRSRILAAVSDFVDHQHFTEALTLMRRFPPMFSRAEQLQIEGDTLEQWGNRLLSQSPEEDWQAGDDHAATLHHLRAAGLAFEQLAELRFATRSYTEHLWKSAENYYRGHSFSRTIHQLEKYLHYEPQLRNAEALLRLGQAHLTLGHIPESIAALEECIEFHPLDSSTHQARIDGAKAHWYQGNTERAEQLLRDNIAGSTLKPSSREWRDSLFELGMLLHETGRHEQAITTLEEAVERYPNDQQTLVAQYLIGESYRRWSEEVLDRVRQSRTVSEREKNQQLAQTRLTTALNHFEEVQRNITLRTHDVHSDPLMGTMLRNCYMLEGTVLFDLGRYKEAIEAYSNVSSLYPDEPFVLETFVQIANCWRRLQQPEKARGAIQQAQIALDRLAADADFATTTSFNRDEWRMLLADMRRW